MNATRSLPFSEPVRASRIAALDARAKIVLMIAYSIGILLASSVSGVIAFCLIAIAFCALSGVRARRYALALAPVFALAAFTIAFAFMNNPGFEGASTGLLLGARMVALVAVSMSVCFTTSMPELVRAFSTLATPLRRLGVRTDDVAVTLALSVRFIPAIADEFANVRNAQRARGGDTRQLGLRRMLQVWGNAFSALSVGLFRHADCLAAAMDARCYGASTARTSLHDATMGTRAKVLAIAGAVALVALGLLA